MLHPWSPSLPFAYLSEFVYLCHLLSDYVGCIGVICSIFMVGSRILTHAIVMGGGLASVDSNTRLQLVMECGLP